MSARTATTTNEGIVLDLIYAINSENFYEAARLLTDGFSFVGVLGTRNGATAYVDDLKRMKIKYKIHKVLAKDNDVCVLCDYTLQGRELLGCNWYTVDQGKVSSLKSIFDPRPLLEKK